VAEQRRTFAEEFAAGVPPSLPFGAYLIRAYEEWCRRQVLDNLPAWKALYEYVRLVKGHPATAGRTPKQVFRDVDRQFQGLRHSGSTEPPRTPDAWLYWFGVSRPNAEATFLDVWDRILWYPGRSPLQNALEQAARKPLGLSAAVLDRRPDSYPFFVSVAGWLQASLGEANIMLPCHEVADLLELDPSTISRYRKWAVADGYLVEVKEARYGGKPGAGNATEFRFNVGRFPDLAELLPPAGKGGTP
jgi:hypothetical protein